MTTPIVDYINKYIDRDISRLHMPGHKGCGLFGFEKMDITEINGADALYHADGIIAESEENTSKLFGSKKTLFSTEGSSQCIKTMLHLASLNGNNKVLAARNVHSSFIHGAALLDLEVDFIGQASDSICACVINHNELEEKLKANSYGALYVTSPDYLGNSMDIRSLSELAHRYNTLLIVDNAHGAYLRFVEYEKYPHPLSAGADMCCDSAHKTLPVLTGGAYLHLSESCNQDILNNAKSVMNIYGSTSPSYLTLASLDACNQYLSDGYKENLKQCIARINGLKSKLDKKGWKILPSDPLKLTIIDTNGRKLSQHLRDNNIECEFADINNLVMMFTEKNADHDYERILDALLNVDINEYNSPAAISINTYHKRAMSIRQAVMGSSKSVPVNEAVGKVCAATSLSCPPAVPIVIPGEVIEEADVNLMHIYGINNINIVS